MAIILAAMGCDPGDSANGISESLTGAGEELDQDETTGGEAVAVEEGFADEGTDNSGMDSDEEIAVEEVGQEGESEVVSEEEVIEEDEFVAAVDGIPAPGSVCPIPEPWGYMKGDNLKNMAFKNCKGEFVTMYDAACGAAVSWVYFTYGW